MEKQRNKNIENKYVKIIRNSGLVHASSRKFPLITVSCIFFGYINILSRKAGYSYKNIGAVGKKDQAQFLINEEKIGESFSKIINEGKLDLLIRKSKDDFNRNKQIILKKKKENDYFMVLENILNVYPEILSQIGFYNSIMRYVKNDKKRAKRLGNIVYLAAKDKDVIANLIYLEIEPFIKKCVKKIGEDLGIEGDLLRYTTLRELKKILKEKQISKEKIIELPKRKLNYLYLLSGNKEYVVLDKKIIDDVRNEFINTKNNLDILKGTVAYPGKVTGKVYKAFHGVKVSKPGYVLVTNITKPVDTPLLKRFAAIVTNEGGILSHISVFAREFKIPSIMSTKIATKVIKDGDLVEVDADKGMVKILKRKN